MKLKLNPFLKCTVRLLVIISLTSFVLVSIKLADATRYAGSNQQWCNINPQQCPVPTNDALPIPSPERKTEFDITTAKFILDGLLRLHYLPPHPGVQLLADLHTKSTANGKYSLGQVFTISSQPGTILILMRGTKYFQDWMANFALSQTSHRLGSSLATVFRTTLQLTAPHRLVALTRGSLTTVNGIKRIQQVRLPDDVMVHDGFLTMYEKIRDQIWKIVDQPTVQRVWIGGHSLGGAMANLCAVDLAANAQTTLQDVRIYTVGAPRVGNPQFATLTLNAPQVSQFYQIQNTADVIPTLPISVVPNFNHPQHPFTYEHGGRIMSYSANWGALKSNHSVSNYMTAVTQIK